MNLLLVSGGVISHLHFLPLWKWEEELTASKSASAHDPPTAGRREYNFLVSLCSPLPTPPRQAFTAVMTVTPVAACLDALWRTVASVRKLTALLTVSSSSPTWNYSLSVPSPAVFSDLLQRRCKRAPSTLLRWWESSADILSLLQHSEMLSYFSAGSWRRGTASGSPWHSQPQAQCLAHSRYLLDGDRIDAFARQTLSLASWDSMNLTMLLTGQKMLKQEIIVPFPSISVFLCH